MKIILKVFFFGMAFFCSVALAQSSVESQEVCSCDDMWEAAIASTYCTTGSIDYRFLSKKGGTASTQVYVEWKTTDSEFSDDPRCVMARTTLTGCGVYVSIYSNGECGYPNHFDHESFLDSHNLFSSCRQSLLEHIEFIEAIPSCD